MDACEWKVRDSRIHSVHRAGGLNWSSEEMLGSQGRNGLASKVRASRQRAKSPPSLPLCRLPQEGVAQLRFSLTCLTLIELAEARFRLKVCVCLKIWITSGSPHGTLSQNPKQVCSVFRCFNKSRCIHIDYSCL